MIAAAPSRWAARPRVTLIAGVGLAAALALLLSIRTSEPPPDPVGSRRPLAEAITASSRSVEAYESAIEAPISAGAFTVAEGMRPGITDIGDGRYPDEVLTQMADAWVASMTQVGDELEGITPPAVLAEVHRLYVAALHGYQEAADALAAAARASGPARRDLVDAAASLGEAADDTFDTAKAQLERVKAAIIRSSTEESS